MELPDLDDQIKTILPEATYEFDNNGQLIIYTNLTPLPTNGELVSMSSQESHTL